jgi:hypothetical protein
MCGADRDQVGESEGRKIRFGMRVLVVINLVYRHDDRFARLAKFARQHLVDRSDAVLAVSHKHDHVSHVHGQVGFGPHAFLKPLVVAPSADAARVHNRKRTHTGIALCHQTITGYPGLIVNDGNPPLRQTVEQGRFADVWPADDSDGWQGSHGFLTYRAQRGIIRGIFALLAFVAFFTALER